MQCVAKQFKMSIYSPVTGVSRADLYKPAEYIPPKPTVADKYFPYNKKIFDKLYRKMFARIMPIRVVTMWELKLR